MYGIEDGSLAGGAWLVQCAGIQMSSAQIVVFSHITFFFILFYFIAVTVSAETTVPRITMHMAEPRILFYFFIFFYQKKAILVFWRQIIVSVL